MPQEGGTQRCAWHAKAAPHFCCISHLHYSVIVHYCRWKFLGIISLFSGLFHGLKKTLLLLFNYKSKEQEFPTVLKFNIVNF